jgi:DNA polymerase I
MEKLYLLDGNSYVYRAFHAIRGLKDSSGFPTNAIYGFSSMLIKVLTVEKPGYMAVIFDFPAPTFRHKLYSDYKAKRPPMPDELRMQFPVVKEVVSAFNIAMFESEGYEADDIIATLARKFEHVASVFVLSQDKDCLQLVSPGIKVIRENKSRKICDEENVRAFYGVPPCMFADCLALCGDSSDNIEGIPGVGWKTAAKLVRRFGNIENLISSIDGLESQKLREAIKDSRGKLLLNKKLVHLDSGVPVKADMEELKVRRPEAEKMRALLQKFEMKKLLDKTEALL